MSRVKTTINKNVIAFDFYANLLEKNKLYEICAIFGLGVIYIDIYGAKNRKYDFYSIILEKQILITQIDKAYGYSIKVNIHDLPIIVSILEKFDFDEMIIWDCYTNWENYIVDKNIKLPFSFKPVKVESQSKFYLNYNPYEGYKVEIICDRFVGDQLIKEKLLNIINS